MMVVFIRYKRRHGYDYLDDYETDYDRRKSRKRMRRVGCVFLLLFVITIIVLISTQIVLLVFR